MKHLLVALLLLSSFATSAQEHPVSPTDVIVVTGSVKKSLTVNISDLMHMKQTDLGDVPLKNKKGEDKGVLHDLKGVLLRDVISNTEIVAAKHKNYSELCIVLTASDGYTNVYSWNELFNTAVGDKVYIVTSLEGKDIAEMPDRILVMSLADKNSGSRHLKGLQKIEVKKPD
ncbi:MAG: hypothetical protein KF744_05390 [Taibaiella sp.]|nr:hypothetical protein [Taibaiella sp.]